MGRSNSCGALEGLPAGRRQPQPEERAAAGPVVHRDIAFVRFSMSAAISMFSSSGTADPSHMCDWKIGLRPAFTSSSEAAINGSTNVSRAGFGQWSVCRATVTG